MLKSHKIFSVGLGLMYLVTLAIFSNPVPIFRFLLPGFLLVLAVTFFYNREYLRQTDKYNFWIILRPILLQTSGFLLFLLLPDSFSRGIFFLAMVALISVFEAMLANSSENLLFIQCLLVAFGFCFAFFGLGWYFPGFGHLILFGLFFCLLLLCRSFYDFLPLTDGLKWLNSVLVSFLSVQVFWAASFLPFHYSVLAILLLNFFYLILVINYHSLFYTLTAKKLKFYLGIAALSLFLVFASTPWEIIDR